MALSERLPSETVGPREPAGPALEVEAPSEPASDVRGDESNVILDIRDLKTDFFTYDGVVKALDGVNIKIRRGETIGLVGETGCGKSVTAFSVTRLINDPPGRVVSGKILFKGADLLWGLDREARFVLSNGREIRRALSAIDAAVAQLATAYEANEGAQRSLTEIKTAADRLRTIFIGTDPEVGRSLSEINRACERLAVTPEASSGAASSVSAIRATTERLETAFSEGRVKVKRSFRRIKSATDRLSAIRGKSIAMIFQEPTQAMNPVFSIANQLGEVLLLHRGIQIIDEMLAVDLESPDRDAAIEALVATAAEGNREATAAAAGRLGEAVRSGSFGTQAFYLVRDLGPLARESAPDVRRALHRLRLRPLHRRYLSYRRRLLEIRRATDAEHFEEMREGRSHRGALRRLRLRELREHWLHFYFGLWGVRSRIQRPLTEELFWRVVKQLEGVAIANPAQIAKGYPHELSGGMLQRVMISMALSPQPDVLIADEPTTALDVTIQAQILELMRELKERIGSGIMLITHDLAVIAEVADRVSIMYAGSIVEQGPVREIFRRPLHPYAQGLLASIPRIDQPEKELTSIPGSVPDLIYPPPGCRFHPRCSYAMPVCKEARPPMTLEGPEHSVACYLYKGTVVAD